MSILAHGFAPRMNPISPRRSAVVAAVDIGTSKIACLIARLKPFAEGKGMRGRTHSIDVIGAGYTRAHGLKGGAIADLARAEESVRQAVDAAERMAGVEIASIVLAFGGGRLGSECFAASVQLRSSAVEQRDISRALDAASLHSIRDGRAVLHSIPIAYRLDGTNSIRDPRGMLGKNLSVDLHVVTADLPALKNLILCVERCHLSVENVVAAPYAAGLATLSEDEMELGATVIDFGAGTTTVAAFAGGYCLHVDGIALGGHHITMDLARGLSMRVAKAERLKTLHGSVLGTVSDAHRAIEVSTIGGGDTNAPKAISHSQIIRMVRPRAEEILEMLRDRLHAAGMSGEPGRQIVLTGAAAQLTGLCELTARVFGRMTRLARPLGITGLNKTTRVSTTLAVAAGLLVYPQYAGQEHFEPRRRRAGGQSGYLTQVGRWLRESF